MARRSGKRPYAKPHRRLDMTRLASMPRSEERGERSFRVQHVSSGRKPYTCPGCLSEIPQGTAHVVVWATDQFVSAERMVEGRRHWHASCWHRGLRPA
ncbi:hypothetical protein H8R18_02650 [Nanchangia anserum]|uniref:ATP/GTP-binding protein n=1 Tax=Nanchangia anserum TaxID=2692125 RepID=A0A8I0GCV0_9ACTO|nr:hypothetical protein [Nanchangia anserum]MBD3689926.1 hypothetical protein [Nanchangia anserum]QOX82259.1 hypothetical protein H8R18_02650 [Nanchangia anserum]